MNYDLSNEYLTIIYSGSLNIFEVNIHIISVQRKRNSIYIYKYIFKFNNSISYMFKKKVLLHCYEEKQNLLIDYITYLSIY